MGAVFGHTHVASVPGQVDWSTLFCAYLSTDVGGCACDGVALGGTVNVVPKIFANSRKAVMVSVPFCVLSEVRVGCAMACVNSCAANVACSKGVTIGGLFV